ncbi:hypothetical protein [Penaeicola halotolerans]|uniref:hypothetical protein n=1 Tax=Penaeicola halotolerans TaxID=2793196 RepID=UPI001CF8C209|nr:hypothetical protein [Penaeicola halotolerans]
MKQLLTFVFTLCISISTLAQIKQEKRLTFELEPNDSEYMVFPVKGEAIFLIRNMMPQKLFDKKQVELIKIDEDFNAPTVWRFEVKDGRTATGFDYEAPYFYLLIGDPYSKQKDLTLYTINTETELYSEQNIDNLLSLELQDFAVIDNKAIFFGKYDYRPAIQIFDMSDRTLSTVRNVYNNNTEVLDLRADQKNDLFDLFIKDKDSFKNMIHTVYTFDAAGEKIRSYELEIPERIDVEAGMLSNLDEYGQITVGSYNSTQNKEGRGFFIASTNIFGETEMRWYPITDMPDYFRYLKEKPFEKMQRRILRKKEKGAEIKVNHSSMMRDIYLEDEYDMVFTEIYYPITRGTRNSFANTYGNRSLNGFNQLDNFSTLGGQPFAMGGSNNVVSEYKYIGGNVMVIDKQGELEWSYTVGYNSVRSTKDDGFAAFGMYDKAGLMAYYEDMKIKAYAIKDGKPSYELEAEISLSDDTERLRSTVDSSVELQHWYQDNFIISGVQFLRRQAADGSVTNHKVFFVNQFKVLSSEEIFEMEKPDK